ncbi:MAG TPA: hypothetical protein VFS12_09320 [Terriglobia bacterium]|nr:hypothetical protein [Terriglobia bacterium]
MQARAGINGSATLSYFCGGSRIAAGSGIEIGKEPDILQKNRLRKVAGFTCDFAQSVA